MKYFFILFAFFALISCCHNSESDNKKFNKDSLLIKYRKTACFGACETFSMVIKGNGKVEYIGIANVNNIGNFVAEISNKEIDDLYNEFEKANFWNLKDKYTDNITDLPTIFVTLSIDGKFKEVEDYFGSPRELKVLEIYIDSLINRLNFVKEK
jgi:hypothetical protein